MEEHEKNTNENNKNEITSNDKVMTIGQFIKEAREEKNLSLKQISQKTKISLTQLEFLEKDMLDSLPNKAYVIGYLKSYSKILGIDHQTPVNHLEKTYDLLSPKPVCSEEKENEVTSANTKIYIAGFAILLIFVLFIAFFKKNSEEVKVSNIVEKVNEKVTVSKPITQTQPPIEIPKPETKTVDNVAPPQVAKAENKIEKKQKTIAKEDTLEKEEKKIEVTKEKKEEKYTFKPLRKKLYSIINNVPNDKTEYLPDNIVDNLVPNKQNLFIYAHKGNSWITYQIDDRRPRQIMLNYKSNINIIGDEIKIFFGNVNGTTVFLNGKLLKIPSRSGVRSLVIPDKSSYKYVLPLFIYNKKTGSVISSKKYLEKMNN